MKRCVGLPGQTLQIKDHVVYLDGKPNKEPDNVQYDYFVRLKQDIPDELVRELGISQEDLASLSETGTMPLTRRAYERLKTCTDIVDSIAYDSANSVPDGLYPLNAWTGWTRDNYGPVWIPAKGASVKLTMDNIAVYERPIRVYEHNNLEVKDGKIFINGKSRRTAIRSRWITIGCRVITAIIQPIRVIGVLFPKTTLWASRYLFGFRWIKTVDGSTAMCGGIACSVG